MALAKEYKNLIAKINARLKTNYRAFGITGDWADKARSELWNIGGITITKSGYISAKEADFDLDTIEDTLAAAEAQVPTMKELIQESVVRLLGVYRHRSEKYKTPVPEEITAQAVIDQVNANAFLDSFTADEFKYYYEKWKALAGTDIYDKALEEQLDELFRRNSKHIWTDAEYVRAYKRLDEFAALAGIR